MCSSGASTARSSTPATSSCCVAPGRRSPRSSRSIAGRWATEKSASSRRSFRTSTSARCAVRRRSTRTGQFPSTERPVTSAVVKVVVAPNSFKGTLTATQAAHAIARGVREVMPDAEIVEVPVADGGEGTAEALVTANRGKYEWVNVEGPLGDPVLASFGLIDGGRTAVLELASASGFALVPAARREVKRASTYGFGQLLDAARKAGARSIIAGIGGSATNDAGAGMAQALGVRLLNSSGDELTR